MKPTLLLLLTFLFFSEKSLAQSTVIQPEVFRLATNSNHYCTASSTGKIYYNLDLNNVEYCKSTGTTRFASDYWEGNSNIYYFGKVGINKYEPTYELDISGSTKFNKLLVNGNVGLNTLTPTEKLEIVNRNIVIKSTADSKSWTLTNVDGGDRLELQEAGASGKVYIAYGGNIGIGAIPASDKLLVSGDVAYAESLSLEGKGILQNTNANQLVMYTGTSTTTANNLLIQNNTCGTAQFIFPGGAFTEAPVVVLGQNVTATPNDYKLIISVDNVTFTGGIIRFCNVTGTGITMSNETYSLIALGK